VYGRQKHFEIILEGGQAAGRVRAWLQTTGQQGKTTCKNSLKIEKRGWGGVSLIVTHALMLKEKGKKGEVINLELLPTTTKQKRDTGTSGKQKTTRTNQRV